MRFPRHNVPQFTGNAIWDGPVLTLGSAVGAMLGDPFEFAVSPELDGLRHVLRGHSNVDMIEAMERRWHDEPRYPAYEMARGTRGAFFDAIRRLSPEYLTSHASWTSLVPEPMRLPLEEAIRSGSLGEEAATCAAAMIMDGVFAGRSTEDLWVTSLLAAGAASRNAEADPNTLMRQLYVLAAGGDTTVEVDPTGEIYTTPYETNANAFYGGNMTFIFSPTDDGGSGVDTLYVATRVCPGPPPQGDTASSWHSQWCTAREDGAMEFARSNGDAGEMRTPNYKEPREVDGVLIYDWPPQQSPWGPANSFDFDLSTLLRPLQWALYRAAPESELVLVLCPAAVTGGVYGIRRQPTPPHFVSTKSPPESLGGPRSDAPIAPDVAYATLDRASVEQPARSVPIWGVLFRCASSNLRASGLDVLSGIASQGEGPSPVCEAFSMLQAHGTQEDAALSRMALPSAIVEDLAQQRVWPSAATVDLLSPTGGRSFDVSSPTPGRDEVCVLSVPMLKSERERIGAACGLASARV